MVQATLNVERDGKNLRFAIAAWNEAPLAEELVFHDAGRIDVAVYDSAGTLLWSSNAGRFFAQARAIVSLGPGESVDFTAAWLIPDDLQGPIEVRGALRTTPPIAATPLTVTL